MPLGVLDPHTLEMARFVKGDYNRNSSVTVMLSDIEWNTLQQRRMQGKTEM